jgi:hypothetical protein
MVLANPNYLSGCQVPQRLHPSKHAGALSSILLSIFLKKQAQSSSDAIQG